MTAAPEPMASQILVEEVAKAYAADGAAPAPVLRGVSLAVAPAEFLALMGASGSGKTTLLNLIGGLDTPDSGRVLVVGQDLRALDDDARSAFRLRHIGFVFQFFNLLPHLTVAENIELPLLFLHRPPAEARAAAADLAAEVGLDDKLARHVNQLSGGEMQRVALARALAHRPEILLADEPTGNLDSKTGQIVLDLIRQTAARHRVTVLMATHDAQAAAAADRVVRMADGVLAAAS